MTVTAAINTSAKMSAVSGRKGKLQWRDGENLNLLHEHLPWSLDDKKHTFSSDRRRLLSTVTRLSKRSFLDTALLLLPRQPRGEASLPQACKRRKNIFQPSRLADSELFEASMTTRLMPCAVALRYRSAFPVRAIIGSRQNHFLRTKRFADNRSPSSAHMR